MSMLGAAATELLRHLQRDTKELIPEYQSELIQKIIKETERLYEDNVQANQTLSDMQEANGNTVATEEGDTHTDQQPATGPKPITSTTTTTSNDNQPDNDNGNENIDLAAAKDIVLRQMQIRHTAKLFNKRCFVAYHHERLMRLKKLRWEYGNNLPRQVVANLSREELEWFTDYNDNLASYMSVLNNGEGLDLTLYLHPPKKLYVAVKCMRDYGTYEFSDGKSVVLKKDSLHYLRLSECEKLIHQGVLVHVT